MNRLIVSCLLFAHTLCAAEVAKGVAASNIQTVEFASAALGEARHFNLLLPNDYGVSTARYPVLYLLHGYGDDHTAWSYMTNLSGFGPAHRVIIVMPDGAKSWYVNAAVNAKGRFEDYVAKDLVSYVDAHFRTIPLPRARAIAGLSMGGYGAAYLGLKNYRTFTAIGSFSGALGITHGDTNTSRNEAQRKAFAEELSGIFGPEGSADRTARDPFALLEKVPAAQMPLLYIACGGEDFLIEQNRSFVKLLASKSIPYEYREISPRGHSWDFWDDNLRVFLDLLDRKAGFNAE